MIILIFISFIYFLIKFYVIFMFKIMITPLFGDTDALGHINNNVLGRWFELARNDIFKLLKT